MTVVALSAAVLVAAAGAAPGALDPGFGNGGTVVTDVAAGGPDSASAVAVQADGKVVAAGQSCFDPGCWKESVGCGCDKDFALVRYNADGSLDTRFGTGGKVTTDVSGFSDGARAVAIQSDGDCDRGRRQDRGGRIRLLRARA